MIETAALVGLAAWRVTSLLNSEAGPFDMFRRLREHLGFRHDDDGVPIAWPENVLANIVACPMCLSLWVAAALYGVWRLEPAAVVVLAAMAVAAMIVKCMRRIDWADGVR